MATSSVVGRRKNKHGSLTFLAVKMASRNQEIRPVGAWVEPANHYDCSAVVSKGITVNTVRHHTATTRAVMTLGTQDTSDP